MIGFEAPRSLTFSLAVTKSVYESWAARARVTSRTRGYCNCNGAKHEEEEKDIEHQK